ncbi:hypothetical protein H072_7951 [Dactylellina haptotyla CBS 200.50]|uniref:Uncharacterized protein n=1 Tax=Dactylellina haptotyla (strain CBS 200.50) TaxID=1284197 RepID=S8BSE5_DACHA|nr:hypothetical protein H072_7951 [Dactylellina haptotyla CBS 200.50]
MYRSLRSNLVGLGATLPILLLSLHPPAVIAYEIAFHPFWLALRGIEQFPIHYQVYPRFTCNAVPLDDLEPDSGTVQNVLVRTAADASGPPKVIFLSRTS